MKLRIPILALVFGWIGLISGLHTCFDHWTALLNDQLPFHGFPEIKEALIANKMQAPSIVAPMTTALGERLDGAPILMWSGI